MVPRHPGKLRGDHSHDAGGRVQRRTDPPRGRCLRTNARVTGAYDLHFLGSRAITGEPQRYLDERIMTDLYKSGWVNKACFDLIKEAGSTIDPKAKEKLYFRIQEIMNNDLAPQVFLHQTNGFFAFREQRQEFHNASDVHILLRNGGNEI